MSFLDRFGVDRAVAALSVARMADAMGASMLIVIIPLYVAQLAHPLFDLPESVLIGLLISLYGIVFTIAQPISGALSDRLHRRKLFIQGGLVLAAVATVSFIFAQQYSDLVILRVLQGIGVAVTIPASLAILAVDTQQQTRGGSMGLYSTFRMIGFATGPLLGGWVYVQYGFNAVFILGAIIVFVSVLLVQAWVHDSPIEKSLPDSSGFHFMDRRFFAGGIAVLGVAILLMSSAYSMMSALENEFNSRMNLTAFQFGIAFSALTVSRLIFQVPIGRLSDRTGRRYLIVLGLLLMAPVTALMGFAASLSQLTFLRLAQGLTSAAIIAPGFALAGDLAIRGGEGQQMSVLSMGFGLGIAIGPLIAGFLAVYAFQLPFMLVGVMLVAGALLVYRYVPETLQPTQPAASELQTDPSLD
jgi:MFS family permease